MKILVIIVSLSLFWAINAETHITGDISGMTMDMSGNPYIVEQDIMIPEGKKVVIKEGCVFLFKIFTTFTVQGQLAINGTQDHPVIFSSINDGEFNPTSEQLANPFDWNGILVLRESGTVSFSYFALRYSVYGIKSQNPNIKITNGVFRQNGQFNFTINDKIQFVQDNIPYSFDGAGESEASTPTNASITQSGSNPPPSQKRLITRYVGLGVGIAGTITGIAFGAQVPGALNAWHEHRNTDFASYKNTFLLKRNVAIAGGVFGAVGLTIFGLTYIQ